jgi:hypothetical protein
LQEGKRIVPLKKPQQSLKDMNLQKSVVVFNSFLPFYEAQKHFNFASSYFLDTYKGNMPDWDSRTKTIEETEIVELVQKYLENMLNVKLTCSQAQYQLWPEGSESFLHKHDSGGRESTDFNSLIYLNDDYIGGEFITEHNFVLKPKIGDLTFFNGANVAHGVNPVLKGDRYTMIFWWTNTILRKLINLQ